MEWSSLETMHQLLHTCMSTMSVFVHKTIVLAHKLKKLLAKVYIVNLSFLIATTVCLKLASKGTISTNIQVSM